MVTRPAPKFDVSGDLHAELARWKHLGVAALPGPRGQKGPRVAGWPTLPHAACWALTEEAYSLFAAGCIYGRPGVRLAARYLVSPDGRCCVATVAGSAGEAVLRVFTGLCTARLGEDGFRVEHIGSAAPQ